MNPGCCTQCSNSLVRTHAYCHIQACEHTFVLLLHVLMPLGLPTPIPMQTVAVVSAATLAIVIMPVSVLVSLSIELLVCMLILKSKSCIKTPSPESACMIVLL